MSDNQKMQWYTLHVYSSMEKSVVKALEERIARSELRDSFGQVLLPIERIQEVRNGRKYTSERRMYPGYVFIQMEMNDATWHLVNATPRVIEFLGNNNPVVLSQKEVDSIMEAMGTGEDKPRPKIEFEVGEEIRVKNGPFKDFNGHIEAVDYDKSRLQVFVSSSAATRWSISPSTKSRSSNQRIRRAFRRKRTPAKRRSGVTKERRFAGSHEKCVFRLHR